MSIRSKRARFDEGGYTLIEALAALSVLGICGATLLGGLNLGITGSDLHRKQANAHSALVQGTEAIKAASYEPCTTSVPATGPYSTALSTVSAETGIAATKVTKIELWNGTAFVAWYDAASAPSPAPCGSERKLQLITVESRSSDNKAVQSTSMVKRLES